MQTQNILNQFKKSRGEYCAINQFVELAKRSLINEHKSEMGSREKLEEFSKRYSVSLSYYDVGFMLKIVSRSYIVNIHLCFETFLKKLCEQIKKYGKHEFQCKIQGESWLECASKNILKDGVPENLKPTFSLCEYYRLIRNNAVHDLDNVNSCQREYQKLLTYDFKKDAKFEKLSAPNQNEEITFDDFVMFARSSMEVAEYLFDSCMYDYEKIIYDIPQKYKNKWRKWENNRQRGEKAILSYMKSNYNSNESLREELSQLFDLIMA